MNDSKLVAIVYDDMYKAGEVLTILNRLEKEYLIDMEDAVYVIKDKDNKIKLHQTMGLTGAGAVGGSFWGLLIGALFFAPIAGMAIGAGAGALAGKWSDIGVDDNFVKELSSSMKPESSALFLLVRSATPDKVLPEISKYGGKVMSTSLPKEGEEKLQKALDNGKKKSAQHYAVAG